MEFLLGTVTYVIPFLIVLTVLVFVHEMGHYSIARRYGVRVEVFSIGFGPEIYGWDDKHGTRWKISAVPLGGYVKFFGDEDAASTADKETLEEMTEAEKAVSFHHQPLWPRIAIVAAGPLANFAYAIVVLAALFMIYGQRLTPAEIGTVMPGSVGEAAGFKRGDVVTEVGGRSIDRFETLFEEIALNPGRELTFIVSRDSRELTIVATPEAVERDQSENIVREVGDLGLLPSFPAVIEHVFPGSAAEAAGIQVGDEVIRINGHDIGDFEDLRVVVRESLGETLSFFVLREGREVELFVTPREEIRFGPDGETEKHWLIGIVRARPAPVQLGIWQAV
jgi:regulator of sigma E protease